MRYYAIADLHGRFDLLEKARLKIKEDTYDLPENEFKVITLGDYIDRGPQSKQIIDSLMETQRLFPYMVCLKGNHEDMAVTVCGNPHQDHLIWWMGNGGAQTLHSYGHPQERYEDSYKTSMMDEDHLKWMANLPLYYETEKQVFVHAGIPTDGAPLEKQNTEKMMWMLYGPRDHGGWCDKHVVHGHHQFADGPHEWSHRTDLDTFAWHEGRLVIGVFDDTQGKALRYIEVLGDDYDHKAFNLDKS